MDIGIQIEGSIGKRAHQVAVVPLGRVRRQHITIGKLHAAPVVPNLIERSRSDNRMCPSSLNRIGTPIVSARNAPVLTLV